MMSYGINMPLEEIMIKEKNMFPRFNLKDMIFDDQTVNSTIYYYKNNEDNFIELDKANYIFGGEIKDEFVLTVYENCEKIETIILQGENNFIEDIPDKIESYLNEFLKKYISKWEKE